MSDPGRWPSAASYVAAMQHPEQSLIDARLGRVRIREGLLGLPASASGQNAIVFPGQLDAASVAIRCFTTPAVSGRKRYQALQRHLEEHACAAMTPAIWHDEGIRVDAAVWPVVEMAWAPGDPLHVAVERHRDDPERLDALADRWRELVRSLRTVEIAHSDLQHGNVLVDDEMTLRLVDFDGVWLPSIADLAPHEVGHPNYQHPERIETGAWGEHIDAFSALVVYLSLRALAADPSLWEHHNGENLILTAADYRAPGQTPIWAQLFESPSTDVQTLTGLLEGLARTTVAIDTDLDTLLETHQVPDAPSYVGAESSGAGAWWSPQEPVSATVLAEPATSAIVAWSEPASATANPTARAAWIVAAIVLALAVSAAAVLLTRNEGDQDTRSSPTSETAPATTTPTTAPPTTVAPVTAAPVTAAPVTAPPVTAAPVTAPRLAPPTQLPAIITASFNGSQICASWSAVPGAEWYDGDYRLTSSGASAALGRNPNTSGCQSAGSVGEVCFRIRAGNSAGTGPYSYPYCIVT